MVLYLRTATKKATYIPPTNAPDYRDRILAAKTLTVANRVTYDALLDPLVQWRKGSLGGIAVFKKTHGG